MSFFTLNPVTVAVSLTCAMACGTAGSQSYQVNVKKRGQSEVQSYTLKDKATTDNRTVSLAVTSPRGRTTVYGQDNVSAAVLNGADALELLPNEQFRYTSLINEAALLRAQADTLRAEVGAQANSNRTKAGWSAVTDGASTLGVLAAGGMEFNPLMPVSPAGIVAVTAAKVYAATAMIDDMEPTQKERTRRLASAGWTGATVANVAALAGLFPATAIPLGAAAGLLQYQAGAEQAEKLALLAQLDDKVDTLVSTAQSYRTQALIAAHQRKTDRLYVRPVVQEVLVASADNAVVFEQIKPQVNQAITAQLARSTVRQPNQNAGFDKKDPRFANVGAVYIYTDEEVQHKVSEDKLSAERAVLVQQQLQAGLSQRQATTVAASVPAPAVVPVPVSMPAARPVRSERSQDLPPVSISTPYGAYTPHPSKRAALVQAGLMVAGSSGQPVVAQPAANLPVNTLAGADPWTPTVPLAQVTPLPRGAVQVSGLNGESVASAAPLSTVTTVTKAPTMVSTVLNAGNTDVVQAVQLVAQPAPEQAAQQAVQMVQAIAPVSLRVDQDTYARAMAFVQKVAGPVGVKASEATLETAPVVAHATVAAVAAVAPVATVATVAAPPAVAPVATVATVAAPPAVAPVAASPATLPVSRLVRETLAVPAEAMAVSANPAVSADAEPGETEDLAQQMPTPDRAAIGSVRQISEMDTMQVNFALGRPVAVDPNAVSPLAPVFDLPSRRVPTIKAVVTEFSAGPTLADIPRQYDFDKKTIPRYLQANPAPVSPVVSYWD